MDVRIGDKIERVAPGKFMGAMKVGKIVTVKEIVSEGKVRVNEESGVWHLIYFKKLNTTHELWT
jgi:hypothetical protein